MNISNQTGKTTSFITSVSEKKPHCFILENHGTVSVLYFDAKSFVSKASLEFMKKKKLQGIE
jgi:hypothetical protein